MARYRFYKCSDPFVRQQKERLIEIATRAFFQVSAADIERRLNEYDDILLILSKSAGLIGFCFCTEQRYDKKLLVGARFTAVDPTHKGMGYVRIASLFIVSRYIRRYLWDLITGKSRQLFFFSRQCNPIAYCSIYGGQEIFPDLIRNSPCNIQIPPQIRQIYEVLKSSSGMPGLDENSGVILNGASDAGLQPNVNFQPKGWKTPWKDYVPPGSELVCIVPFGARSVQQFIWAGAKRLLLIFHNSRMGLSLGDIWVTSKVAAGSMVTAILLVALILLQQRSRALALVQGWARWMLWAYGTSVEIVGEVPREKGMMFLVRHTSLLDTFIYPAILPADTIYLAKTELAKIPLLSWIFRKLGHHFIERANPRKAAKTLIAMKKEMTPLANIFIHPEGTRTKDTEPRRPLSGFKALTHENMLLVPISSWGGDPLWPKGTLAPRRGRVLIKIGDPLPTENEDASETLFQAFQNDVIWFQTKEGISPRPL